MSGREFRGANLEFMNDHSKEVILSGPAGTGKSVTALNKLMLIALKYPESRQLIIRKTRDSLTESGLVTWEEKVLPPKLYQTIASNMKRQQRSAYTFPNKSEVVVGGIDKPGKIMSTEYDIIYAQEAIELEENDWESLTTRLRNYKVPYQQLIGDTNPDAPKHWIKQRENNGLLKILESRHEDNPFLFNADGSLTQIGREYIETLDRLTGTRKDRLRFGKWVQTEGAVYPEFDRKVNLINRFEIPRPWQRYWSFDFGYTNAFVWQCWAEDHDGRLYLYREIYFTQRLVEDHAAIIKDIAKSEPMPMAVICDHDAEDRATLERHASVKTIPAIKMVSPGIQAVKSRLAPAGDGKPRLFILRDSLYQRDARLDESKLPASTLEEFDMYIWDTSNNRKQGEEPVKKFDHGMDAMRYMVAYKDLQPGSVFSASAGGQRTGIATLPQPQVRGQMPQPPPMPGVGANRPQPGGGWMPGPGRR
jgi:PBSX family phage terminase large subunit